MIEELDVEECHMRYESERPFPHIVLDDIWDAAILESVRLEVEEFSDWAGEKRFYGSMYKAYQADWKRLPPLTSRFLAYLNGPDFLQILEAITGEKGLISDPYLEGGGIHSIGRNGFLKLHADFNWHEKMRVYRRLNVLVYLNKDWKKDYQGQLQLAGKNELGNFVIEKSVEPLFNTTVIFTTDDCSYHGHPEPLQTPEDVRRNSIACYYYQAAKPNGIADNKRVGTDYVDSYGKKMRPPMFKHLVGKLRKGS